MRLRISILIPVETGMFPWSRCFCLLSVLFWGLPVFGIRAEETPPLGAYVPGELRLAGLSRVGVDQPVQVGVWAIRPERPYHYSGAVELSAPQVELKLELRNADGRWVGGGEPRLRHGQWQSVTLSEGLKAGRYEAVLTLLYDGLPFSRVRKGITVLSVKELAATPGLTAEQIATAGKLETTVLDGGQVVARLPGDSEVTLAIPGQGSFVVYGTFVGAASEFSSAIAGTNVAVSGWGSDYLRREVYLGYAQGEANTLALRAGKGGLQLAGLRFKPVTGSDAELAGHDKPTRKDKTVAINNDGFSEGFFDPDWKIEKLPLQVQRYQDTDATQLDWCVLVSDVVSYRSKFAEFYGENHDGDWPTKGEQSAARFFQELEQHEPKMVPWLVATGREIGLPIWGSLRMSVSYGNHPFGKAFNGAMWRARPEWRVKKTADEPDDNENPLSFAYAEVQAVRIGVLTELAEMGCEGVNLDYCRYPLIMGYDEPLLKRFQEVHGEDGKNFALDDVKWVGIRQEAHNAFLRKLRQALDKLGDARGKRVPISIRLPATKFESFGFDPKTWIKDGLVDVLIPGFPGMDRWFDAGAWTEMTKNSKVKVWTNMEYYRHETGATELTDDQVTQGIKPGYQFKNAHENYLRRAAEVYPQGADGMYIFNRWNHPKIFYGLSDSVYVHSWQQFQNSDNLDSAVKMTSK